MLTCSGDLSRITHRRLRGHDTSWCAYAYHHQANPAWARFVRIADAILGQGHCCRSHARYY